MAIREIITVPNPLLKTISKSVDKIDDKILGILDDMLETMYAAPGIGLAAIQIGIPKRMLVIDISKDDENKDPHFFINPEILNPAENLSTFEEGCLSVPGVWEEIERPDECNVRFLDTNGFSIDSAIGVLCCTPFTPKPLEPAFAPACVAPPPAAPEFEGLVPLGKP